MGDQGWEETDVRSICEDLGLDPKTRQTLRGVEQVGLLEEPGAIGGPSDFFDQLLRHQELPDHWA